MNNLDFVRKLYNGKNCYSDHMDNEHLELLHISSRVEKIVSNMLQNKKIVFLTGNPGDGKTFIIKLIEDTINKVSAYYETDMNSVTDYSSIIDKLIECYRNSKPAIIAINEYPFLMLCKELKSKAPEIYSEISKVRNEAITYDLSSPLISKIAVIDLNERNFLDPDRNLSTELIEKIICLLSDDVKSNRILESNVKALSNDYIKGQLIALFELVAMNNFHFAIRDILGAFSFIFTACTLDEYIDLPYYSAIFKSNNPLLQALKAFDPINLSDPTLDEKIWNGEIKTGWIMETPDKWPCSSDYYDDVDGAVECFINLKRKYYFENSEGKYLRNLQPDEIKKCNELFVNFESQRKKYKEKIIHAINKLFLPSIDDKKQLHIWTTLNYDISIEAATVISSKAVDSSDLEIYMPRPADWLKTIEYVPNHIVLKPKSMDNPKLYLDLDFLYTLEMVENGYPIGLIASHYEQSAAMFLRQLDDISLDLVEENDDGELIIASRNRSFKKKISIINDKYGFEEDR